MPLDLVAAELLLFHEGEIIPQTALTVECIPFIPAYLSCLVGFSIFGSYCQSGAERKCQLSSVSVSVCLAGGNMVDRNTKKADRTEDTYYSSKRSPALTARALLH
jgi:hypothetical protein